VEAEPRIPQPGKSATQGFDRGLRRNWGYRSTPNIKPVQSPSICVIRVIRGYIELEIALGGRLFGSGVTIRISGFSLEIRLIRVIRG
jgi:hypothetical protein